MQRTEEALVNFPISEDTSLDFPDGTLGKNPPVTVGDMGSIAGPGTFHMPWGNKAREPQLLSPLAATPEAHGPETCAPQQEATATRSPRAATEQPPSLQLEKACAQQQKPSATKK